MKGQDKDGQKGPKISLPDTVKIMEPPVDKVITEPTSDHRDAPAVVAPPAAAATEEPAAAYQQPEGAEPEF